VNWHPPSVPRTSLVGREGDAFLAAELLRQAEGRLLTLVGPGGVGKTRLALRIAGDLYPEFANGVAVVSLAPVHTANLVGQAVVDALGVSIGVDQSPIDRLATLLEPLQLLLVLDNFEQVIEAGPFVGELLDRCPRLSVLVTSRMSLSISGEQRYMVPPLTVPERAWHGSASEAEQMSAVHLFRDRAHAADPTFSLTDANAPTVAEICRWLDGLPLAIELAAARVTLFTPVELLKHLEHRLPQLTSGFLDQPARLKTMRGSIAWSYDLLTPPEQAVFRCLSVFVGGFSLEAADAVCRPALGSPSEVMLDVLASLTRQSLLQMTPVADNDHGEVVTRLTMLETIREFGAEQLSVHGNGAPQQRHAAYYLARVRQAELTYWGDAPGDWRAEISREVGNFRAALAWAISDGETDLALQLASAMFNPHVINGDRAREQLGWVQRALALPGGSPRHRVQALIAAVWLAQSLYAFAEARATAESALSLAHEYGDTFGFAMASYIIGEAEFHEGNLDVARRHLIDAVTGFRAAGAPHRAALPLCYLASLDSCDAIDEGGDPAQLARAAAYYEEALALFRQIGMVRGIARALNGLAYVAYKQRDLLRALALAREVLALDWAGHWLVYHYLEDIADIAGRLGHPRIAARLYGAAEAQRERDGRPIEPVYRAEYERDLAITRDALDVATFGAAWSHGRAMSPAEAVALALKPFEQAPEVETPPAGLTRREHQVLQLLIAGRSDREIADILIMSVRTAEGHVARVLDKLGVHTREEAVDAAIQGHLLDTPATSKKRSPGRDA
jgi:non-specific serine/threonine protein kinase